MGDGNPSTAPDTGSRGDATREALIGAAVELFGRRGYHAASNRALAEAAGVNAALIGYHFGGKEGLYLAAFEHIAARMGERVGPMVAEVEAALERAPEDGAAPDDFLPLLHRLLDGFVAVLNSEESASWARLIVREQQDPTDAFDILYRGMMGRALRLITRLVHRIEHSGAEEPEEPEALERSRLTALTIAGQALVFRIARTTALRHMEWDGIGPDEIARIQSRVRRNATALLLGA